MTETFQAIAAATADGDVKALSALAIALAAEVERLRSQAAAYEARKRGQRERTARSRGTVSRDVTLRNVTERDVTDGNVTACDGALQPPPPPSPPLSSPTPPINPSSPAPTPAALSRAAGASDAASDAETALRTLMGDLMPAVEDFLRSRPPQSRRRWYAELLRIVGPATGNLPVDLATACGDALLVQPPVAAPGPLRDFVQKHRLQRLGLTGARQNGNGNGAHDRGGGSSASARAVEDTGADVLASIRELIDYANTPGQGSKPFIRMADVERLGPRAVAAYREIGGAERVLGTTPDKLGLLQRDFSVAWRRAGSALEQANHSTNGNTP